jgi:hypothetical protein
MRRRLVTIACSALTAISCALEPAGLSVVQQQPDAGTGATSVSAPTDVDEPSRSPRTDGSAPMSPSPADGGGTTPALPDGGGVLSGRDTGAPATIPADGPAPGLDASAPTPVPPPLLILRARNVTAERITAGVVYAHKLQAKTGAVGQAGDPLPGDVLAGEIGREDLKVPVLDVDVLYAQDIQTGRIDVKETHISSIRIDKPD